MYHLRLEVDDGHI